MKLAVFGATGRTGQILVRDALAQGDEVIALARTPSKLDLQDERLSIVQGDVQDPQAVERVVAGAEAVISLLGPTTNRPVFAVSRGMQNILEAMRKHGVQRLVVTAGAGVGDPEDRPALPNRAINLLIRLAARNAYEDMRKTAASVRASDRDWTIVRAPMLVDDEATGNITVGMVGKGMGMRITRADLAAYALQVAKTGEQLHRAPAISSER